MIHFGITKWHQQDTQNICWCGRINILVPQRLNKRANFCSSRVIFGLTPEQKGPKFLPTIVRGFMTSMLRDPRINYSTSKDRDPFPGLHYAGQIQISTVSDSPRRCGRIIHIQQDCKSVFQTCVDPRS